MNAVNGKSSAMPIASDVSLDGLRRDTASTCFSIGF